MTDREKIIELLNSAHDDYYANFDPNRGYMGALADMLLLNGCRLETKQATIDKASEWISVKDILPEPGIVVLVYSKLGCTWFSHRLHHHFEGRPFSIEYSGGWEVTHWMPLPKPPKEEV